MNEEDCCSVCLTGIVSIGTMCPDCATAARAAQAAGDVPVPSWRRLVKAR